MTYKTKCNVPPVMFPKKETGLTTPLDAHLERTSEIPLFVTYDDYRVQLSTLLMATLAKAPKKKTATKPSGTGAIDIKWPQHGQFSELVCDNSPHFTSSAFTTAIVLLK